jgi:hypothetical protein
MKELLEAEREAILKGKIVVELIGGCCLLGWMKKNKRGW